MLLEKYLWENSSNLNLLPRLEKTFWNLIQRGDLRSKDRQQTWTIIGKKQMKFGTQNFLGENIYPDKD